jgi:hypothetical protein
MILNNKNRDLVKIKIKNKNYIKVIIEIKNSNYENKQY